MFDIFNSLEEKGFIKEAESRPNPNNTYIILRTPPLCSTNEITSVAASTAQLNSVHFFGSPKEARPQCINAASMTYRTEPDPALLLVNGRAPTDLEKTRLGLYSACTPLMLSQQCIAISRMWLAALSSCALNSSKTAGEPANGKKQLKIQVFFRHLHQREPC